MLKRAIRTLWIALDGLDQMWIPVINDWRLNERHYGALQGLNKARNGSQARRGANEDLASKLRHSATARSRSRIRATRHTIRRYAGLRPSELPRTESLKDTVARFLPYWRTTIAASIESGRRVVIAAHGNSLRALVKLTSTTSRRWTSPSSTFRPVFRSSMSLDEAQTAPSLLSRRSGRLRAPPAERVAAQSKAQT